jgi:hypothetical protein
MSLFVNTLYDWIQQRRNSNYKYSGTPVYDVSKEDIKSIESVAKYFDIRPEWLANLINFESGGTFNPAITNSIGATGLIQFMPTTAEGLGTSTTELRKMNFQQQMKYVKKYIYNFYKTKGWIDKNGNPIKNKIKQIDLFMIIFYPKSVGNEEYPFPSNVVRANAGISTPKDYFNKAVSAAPFKKLLELSRETTKTLKKNIVPIIIISTVGVGLIVGAILLTLKYKK